MLIKTTKHFDHADEEYLEMMRTILDTGVDKGDRTGTGARSIFGYQMRFDLSRGFPLLTTKKVPFKMLVHELLWFLNGDHNIEYLEKNKCSIWTEWPYKWYRQQNNLSNCASNSEEWNTGIVEFREKIKTDPEFAKQWGELGPVYGYQWRSWPDKNGKPIDQITDIVSQIKKNPNSRRMIVSAWNVSDIEQMTKSGLPPCHCIFQFYVANGKLSCQLYQRSCDSFLGVPFNVASYSLLTMMIASVCGLQPGEFIWTGGDTHIYSNHFDAVREQLAREPRPMPTVKINPEVKDIFGFKIEDFELLGYDPHPPIKADIAV